MLLKLSTQRVINDGEEDDTRLPLNLSQRPLELTRRTDEGIDMLKRLEVGIVSCGSSGHGIEGLACGIRDQMHVEVLSGGFVHKVSRELVYGMWISIGCGDRAGFGCDNCKVLSTAGWRLKSHVGHYGIVGISKRMLMVCG